MNAIPNDPCQLSSCLLPFTGRPLPFHPASILLSHRGTAETRILVVVCHAQRDVDRAQHREHERLHDADECAEHVEQHRDHELREAR